VALDGPKNGAPALDGRDVRGDGDRRLRELGRHGFERLLPPPDEDDPVRGTAERPRTGRPDSARAAGDETGLHGTYTGCSSRATSAAGWSTPTTPAASSPITAASSSRTRAPNSNGFPVDACPPSEVK